jgi:PAS domain S-box-containing protein
MKSAASHQTYRSFYLRIIFPTALAIGLFVLAFFVIIIPAFESNSLARKREMIRELTASAWSIPAEMHEAHKQGAITAEEARTRAIAQLRDLRYGDERKDYFWVTDMTPRMIMHPYRTELEGQDLTEFKDPGGKRLFVEFVKAVEEGDEGYVEYRWQWKDDAARIVPKLSYVRTFEPWGWIIGTGIYIEDVKEETAVMSGRLTRIALVITGGIALLLLYITHQSLRIERQRRHVETELRESKDKYQTLVEAATEGIIMLLEGRQAYFNQTMLDMLGYAQEEFSGLSIDQILWTAPNGIEHGATEMQSLLAGEPTAGQFEARLKRKNGMPVDVVLVISRITFAGKQGFVITARDISQHKEIEEKLGESEEQYKTLTDAINIGVFHASLGPRGRFLEANPAAMRILGFGDREELLAANLLDLFHDAEDRESFYRQLRADGSVKNHILRLKRKDGTVPIVSVSAVLARDEEGAESRCDGVMEDITERTKAEQQREGLIVELQTALLFLNQPVRNSVQEAVLCDMNTPIVKLATLMAKKHANAALVRSTEGEVVGIVTDRDLRERVIAAGKDVDRPIFEIMSSPLISIPARALLFEAALLMQETGAAHLVVRDSDESILGLLSSRDLLQVDRYSSSFLLREIHKADTVEEITHAHDRLPRLVRALIASGANARNIVRVVASVSDAITGQLIRLAIDELGPPPTRFAFLALGSEGREEQTLKTDQDNAIIYDDVSPEQSEEAAAYFLQLGQRVCDSLARVGYALCAGEAMARNPRWCQPLAEWKSCFSEWIRNADANDLIAVSIFFDFRCVHGASELADELHAHVTETADGKAVFFQHLAMNALQYRPPLGFFGKIVVGANEEQPESFDIKKAMMPIVDFARVYTLQCGIKQTNTLGRLQQIREHERLNKSEYEDIVQAYEHLMTVRLKHQAMQLAEDLAPDNFINPKELSQIERLTLRKTLSQIADFQGKLRSDYTGTV